MSAFHDLLAWLLNWKSAPLRAGGPYRLAVGQAFAPGGAAGQAWTAGMDEGEAHAH